MCLGIGSVKEAKRYSHASRMIAATFDPSGLNVQEQVGALGNEVEAS